MKLSGTPGTATGTCMGCSGKEQGASSARQEPRCAVWLLCREPDTSVSPSNGILEVAISARTIPKLEGDKQDC